MQRVLFGFLIGALLVTAIQLPIMIELNSRIDATSTEFDQIKKEQAQLEIDLQQCQRPDNVALTPKLKASD